MAYVQFGRYRHLLHAQTYLCRDVPIVHRPLVLPGSQWTESLHLALRSARSARSATALSRSVEWRTRLVLTVANASWHTPSREDTPQSFAVRTKTASSRLQWCFAENEGVTWKTRLTIVYWTRIWAFPLQWEWLHRVSWSCPVMLWMGNDVSMDGSIAFCGVEASSTTDASGRLGLKFVHRSSLVSQKSRRNMVKSLRPRRKVRILTRKLGTRHPLSRFPVDHTWCKTMLPSVEDRQDKNKYGQHIALHRRQGLSSRGHP